MYVENVRTIIGSQFCDVTTIEFIKYMITTEAKQQVGTLRRQIKWDAEAIAKEYLGRYAN